jgi:hypothetical protein
VVRAEIDGAVEIADGAIVLPHAIQGDGVVVMGLGLRPRPMLERSAISRIERDRLIEVANGTVQLAQLEIEQPASQKVIGVFRLEPDRPVKAGERGVGGVRRARRCSAAGRQRPRVPPATVLDGRGPR